MCDETSGFDTKCLHGGWSGDPATMSKGVPVYRTGALMHYPRPPISDRARRIRNRRSTARRTEGVKCCTCANVETLCVALSVGSSV